MWLPQTLRLPQIVRLPQTLWLPKILIMPQILRLPQILRHLKYLGIEAFLHLLLRCSLKTHAETVAESIGNLVDLHCDKRRGLGVQDVGIEVFIDWNGPPVHLVENLDTRCLNRHFNGGKWH